MTAPCRSGVVVEFDVPARMRDGVVLRADVYRPAGDGSWPTLLCRRPYGKDHPMVFNWLNPLETAAEGFLVVVQDVRGRFASEGDWSPYRAERDDGFDSVEWAAGLRGSNGRVGMFGMSYHGFTQWAAALSRPKGLGAIAPGKTWSRPEDGVVSRGGALELGFVLPWHLELAADSIGRGAVPEDERAALFAGLVSDYEGLLDEGYWTLPVDVSTFPEAYGPEPGGLRASAREEAIREARVDGGHESIEVPVFGIAGWYDQFLQGDLDNFMAMRELGKEARLVVGPWTHTVDQDPVGELRFGLSGSRVGFPSHPGGDLNQVLRAWFRRHLQPGGPEPVPEAPVRIFVMGRNEWRDEESWPLDRARDERWFLGPDRSLGREPHSVAEPPIEFAYDPADPVPALGGGSEMADLSPAGPFDQRSIESRQDVLVFTSAPLKRDLEVTGRVLLAFSAASSAKSTDWVGRLCDVHPDGRSINICDGIVRIAHDADAPARIEVDLWSTSNVFLAGHRLRVHVTSSSFPRWDRNLNTGDQGSSRIEVAWQRLSMDPSQPAYLTLPVVP